LDFARAGSACVASHDEDAASVAHRDAPPSRSREIQLIAAQEEFVAPTSVSAMGFDHHRAGFVSSSIRSCVARLTPYFLNHACKLTAKTS